MGMTYEQYWDGPPFIAVTYRKAHKLKRQMANEDAWLQGMYVFDAVSVALANAFGKKGAGKKQYIEKPIDIFPLTEQEKKQREREEMAKMEIAMKSMIRKQRANTTKGDDNG